MWGDKSDAEKRDDELRKLIRDAGGEMDAPGGGKRRLIGGEVFYFTPKEIEEEKQLKLTTQKTEQQMAQQQEASSALGTYQADQRTAGKLGKIDISKIGQFAQPEMENATREDFRGPVQPQVQSDDADIKTHQSVYDSAQNTGDKSVLDEIAKRGVKWGDSSEVDIQPTRAVSMAEDKTELDRTKRMLSEMGKYRTAQNTPVDMAIDTQVKLAEMEQKSTSPSSRSGWAERIAQAKAIDAMAEGAEKESAIDKFTRDWATSTWAGYQPDALTGAANRAKGIQDATLPGDVLKSGESAAAAAAGRIKAETDAGGGVNPVITDRTSSMRKEFLELPEIKSVKTLQSNASKANKAMTDYKAGKIKPYEVDQSLGYFASKALDPNSVVMPGEFDRFAKGLGLQSAQAMVEQLIGGGLKLTDAQRESMLGIVNRAMDSGKEAAQSQYDYYSDLAVKNGTDPHGVTGGVDYIFKKTDGTTTPSGSNNSLLSPDKAKRKEELLRKKALGTLE